jgi:endonuclease/exonuclease/phosphatase (EEP) superfamily protein YafD
LQEVQLNHYQHLLVQACASYLYSFHEPYLHCPKGGLLTLSRLPMSKHFEPYAERGLWYTPMFMDKLLYKGMMIHTFTWAGLPMVVINTHILANYVGDWERRGIYSAIEEKQLQQLAKTVRSQPSDSIVIVVGDFNVPRASRLYDEFLANSGLTDPLAGDTRPTLRLPFGVPPQFSLPIDYAFVRIPEAYSVKVECDLCFSEKYVISRWRRDYLSDHYGIEISLTRDN